jgi:hypothetical protein
MKNLQAKIKHRSKGISIYPAIRKSGEWQENEKHLQILLCKCFFIFPCRILASRSMAKKLLRE